jgi:hypothetical protein
VIRESSRQLAIWLLASDQAILFLLHFKEENTRRFVATKALVSMLLQVSNVSCGI